MIKVILEIDNKTAHSCSPLEFLRKFILFEAKQEFNGSRYFYTPYANINVIEIEQI
jgi:hypothetical protein